MEQLVIKEIRDEQFIEDFWRKKNCYIERNIFHDLGEARKAWLFFQEYYEPIMKGLNLCVSVAFTWRSVTPAFHGLKPINMGTERRLF
jgi:hypothetical protein